MSRVRVGEVDAALDMLDEEADAAHVLAEMIDQAGGWDWSDDTDGDEIRLAVVESTGAWWLVSAGGMEPPDAVRFGRREEAEDALAQASEAVRSWSMSVE